MNIKTAILTAALALAAAPAFALSIAVLDAQTAITSTNAAKRAVADLDRQRDAARAKIQSLEAPLIERNNKLLEQRSVMAPDKLKAEEEALRKDVMSFRKQAQEIQESFESANIKARKQISDAVKSAVDAIAKEKGYDMVIPKSLVLYSGAGVPDITQEALTRANAILK